MQQLNLDSIERAVTIIAVPEATTQKESFCLYVVSKMTQKEGSVSK